MWGGEIMSINHKILFGAGATIIAASIITAIIISKNRKKYVNAPDDVTEDEMLLYEEQLKKEAEEAKEAEKTGKTE